MQDLSGLYDNGICSSMPKRNSSCTKNEEGIVQIINYDKIAITLITIKFTTMVVGGTTEEFS